MNLAAQDLWQLAGSALNLMFGKSKPVKFDAGGGWLLATGEPSTDLNCGLISNPAHCNEDLVKFLRKFQKLQVPFLICLTEPVQARLQPACLKFGLVSGGELPLMVLERKPPAPESTQHGITVKVAELGSEIESYCNFAAKNFGIQEGVLNRVMPLHFIENGTVKYFLAFSRDGKLCGVGATTTQKRQTGIWSMATEPEHRRKGVASAILSEMFQQAKDSELFFLLATHDGKPLYSKFGFKAAATGHVYAGRFE